MGVNIMSLVFSHDLLKDMPLAPTTKLLKGHLGHIVPVWELFVPILSW
jgi:hypothetical protein